jgi:hypothetical protein
MAHVEGMTRLEQTMKRHYYHAKIGAEIQQYVRSCDECQRMKRGGKTYGEAAPREATSMPWQEIHCDSIGPWEIELRARKLVFKAMTIIDPATNLLEIAPMIDKTAFEGAHVVENTWLSRYPKPLKCVSDQGPEFGFPFQEMLRKNGITHSTSSSRNPQGNSIIERIHASVGQVLRRVVATRNPQSVTDANAVITEVLATAMHATRCAANSGLGGFSPGALAFHRDMYLDIPLLADMVALQANRQDIIDRR